MVDECVFSGGTFSITMIPLQLLKSLFHYYDQRDLLNHYDLLMVLPVIVIEQGSVLVIVQGSVEVIE